MAEPVRTAEAFVVVQLKQHKTATRDEFDKDRDTFVQELVRAKRDEALSLYVKRLREQAKDDIKIDESYVQEAKVDGGSVERRDEDEDEYLEPHQRPPWPTGCGSSSPRSRSFTARTSPSGRASARASRRAKTTASATSSST